MFFCTQLLRPGRSAFASICTLALLLLFISSRSFILAQPPAKLWDKTIGGNGDEYQVKVIQTSDGGYMVAGSSPSNASGDKSENSKGNLDYWIIKLNDSGVKQWDKTIGGNGADFLSDIRQTFDGGYILAGTSQSGLSGDKSKGSLSPDAWIVKLSASGSIEWDNTLGGNDGDNVKEIRQTADGGYIFISDSFSGLSGDKTEPSRGSFDLWVVKLNVNGSKAWDRTYGGSDYEMNGSLSLTADGGYIIGGMSGSGISGDKTQANFGQPDYWILKLSSSGVKEWDRTFGGDNSDFFRRIVQTPSGDYLAAGDSYSGISGNKSADNQGPSSRDFWVVKIDGNGNKIWDKAYGRGGQYDEFTSLATTSDGGFVLGGWSLALDPKEDFDFDYWLTKLSPDGAYQWDKTFAGPKQDVLYSVVPTSDRGYIIGGHSYSGAGPDKSENNNGDGDFWIIRLATDPLPVTLAAFTATKEGNTALLQWKTTSESASSEFEIQHSINGKQWNAIGSVAAAGESTTEKPYQFIHTEPVSGQNNFYRLKMIDTDGSFALSSIKALSFGSKDAARIYPNPVSAGHLTVDVNNWETVKKVQISTISALTVYDSGSNPRQTINVNSLPAGVYILKVFKKDGTSEVFRFVR
ncbi:Por secretion system C-terminal sorting domain-containing protein [Dyadobacter soli]|uniref:Por secretion system C-terminal sorting domain-containing protein n=1 Tax=Dyadobacter soli TaxID=659014 RepID=A0A1G7TNA2_9BACT|nr:T9SS type A sorting domain-containing protein [Dyadobacter soli]SDG36681.1 Por secretion system C-terminal sorting domain-containing protein [Dyadobacter soli]